MMKRIYVAGAYSGPDVLTVYRNKRKGIQFSAEIMKLGFAVYSPWLDEPLHMVREFTLDECYAASLQWVEVSDGVFVVPGYENSKGTQKEIYVAHKLHVPVFYSIKELFLWDKE